MPLLYNKNINNSMRSCQLEGRVINALQTFFHWLLEEMLSDIYFCHLMGEETEAQVIRMFFIVIEEVLTRLQNHSSNYAFCFGFLFLFQELFLEFTFQWFLF